MEILVMIINKQIEEFKRLCVDNGIYAEVDEKFKRDTWFLLKGKNINMLKLAKECGKKNIEIYF